MSYIFWIVALLSLLYIVANIGVDKKLKFEMQLKKLVPKIYYAIFTITLCTFSIHLFKLLIDDFSIAYVDK